MLGKLFKKNSPTDNIGIETANLSKSGGLEKATYITISGHPDSPSIRIEKKVTIGSEVGDLIVEDPEISPRHCSLFINKGIVSIMDHSSSQGTFINKKQLDPGKIFILNNKDKIKLGKYAAKLELLDVPSSETKVEVDNPLSEDHFEDQTATHTNVSLSEEQQIESNMTLDDATGDIPVASEFNEMPIPELPDFEDDLPSDDELSSDDESSVETRAEVDLSDVDVEEEELDISVLPTDIRERHEQESSKRSEKAKKEAEAEETHPPVAAKEEDGDLAGYEVTSKGIKVKTSESGEIVSEIVTPREKLSLNPTRSTGSKSKKAAKKKKDKKKSKFVQKRGPSSYFSTRLIALFYDSLICFIILEIFSVYTDFKTVYSSLPSDLWSLIKPSYDEFVLPHYLKLAKENAIIQDIVSTILEYESIGEIISFVFFVYAFRMICGLIFSVSIGQLLIGMKVDGRFTWKRLIYPVREIFGMITFPLLILEFPAIIGKRTFKEVITMTQYVTRSKKLTFLLVIIVTPLLVLILCFAPLVKGLDLLPPVSVKVDSKALKSWEYKSPVYLKSLNISFDQDADLKVLPSFSVKMKNRKKILKAGVLFVDLKTGGLVNIRKVKNFSMLDVYTSFVDLNLLASEFQPNINSFVRNVARQNKDFKLSSSPSKELVEETLNLVKDIYTFDLETIPNFVLKNGVLMRGFRDFREKMDNLFSEKVQSFDLLQVGSSKGILAKLNAGRNAYYEFIPVGSADGEVYHISEDIKSKKLTSIMRMLYWGELKDKKLNVSQSDSVAKFVNSFSAKKQLRSNQLNQSVYERYFEVCKSLTQNEKSMTLKKLEKELQQFLNVLQSDTKKNKKLIQKLSQLLQAIKDKNLRYFNISSKKKKTV